MASKAENIRALMHYYPWLSVDEIANAIGCSPQYVRVAGHQRRDGASKADKNYAVSSKAGQKFKAHAAYSAAYSRALSASADRDACKAAYRRAYAKARKAGGTTAEAKKAAQAAYNKSIGKTSNRIAARKAARRAKEATCSP